MNIRDFRNLMCDEDINSIYNKLNMKSKYKKYKNFDGLHIIKLFREIGEKHFKNNKEKKEWFILSLKAYLDFVDIQKKQPFDLKVTRNNKEVILTAMTHCIGQSLWERCGYGN